MVENPHSQTADDVAARLQVDPRTGLTEQDATARQKSFGPNLLQRQKTKSSLAILLHQFKGIIVWLLGGAAVFSGFLGDYIEAFAIVLVLLINALIGFVTELRAARSMEALYAISEVSARVRRSGKILEIHARDLVPGDIVLLEPGDIASADMRISSCTNLHCDESTMTGESVPVSKSPEPVADDALLGERTSMVFKGTSVTQGAGEAIVSSIGMETEIGQITHMIHTAEDDALPLERRLDKLGHRLVGLTLGLVFATVILGLFRDQDMAIMIQTGVALAVAAIPEGLPIVATLCLARGMLRMARRNALVNRLSSVETLGSTTMILTDKTGTLTENRMEVVRYILSDGPVETSDLAPANKSESDSLNWALCVSACCNSADTSSSANSAPNGDPMELAMLQVAQSAGFDAHSDCGFTGDAIVHPFDPKRLMMATIHKTRTGVVTLVKGAPEAVFGACTQIHSKNHPVPFDTKEHDRWLDLLGSETAKGLRCLALAVKEPDSAESDPYTDLHLVGLVCLADPIREEVPKAIAACRDAGIDVVMITGDHPETAAAIAREAGIAGPDSTVITGRDLRGFDPESTDNDMADRIGKAHVFARVSPANKLDIVTYHQLQGRIIAMTGDGVNDAPALKKADIGVAMGKRGTQVARDASDIVLLDDAFDTIVAAIAQGRIIFANIRKFVVYLMSCNVSEVMVVGLALGLGMPTPLLPLQILFLNLVTDVFPAFALGLSRGDDSVMRASPRDPTEPIVTRALWFRITWLGLAIAFSTLGAFATALFHLQIGSDKAITVAFLTIALAQLWNVFNVRDRNGGLLLNEVSRNSYVWLAFAVCLVLVFTAIWFAPLSQVFKLPSPGVDGFALAFAASLCPLLFGQVLLARSRI
ncbi:cation-translocating P-type ATPase [Marivita geojedonensis]|uniref:P-type Cu(+) transporter n=1 Tax=Marivita geojedonensis TaxID=1123756 RepID=A0A1X4NL10_9RHOB|nr:cation-transporting P-type ATPase [Marivita geojedonensis]OSQ50887.1 ATPase [Marivita geojedonensis]